jgi:2-haloacid dehalogenase
MSFDVIAFDAYGTLFDVFSVTELCETLCRGKGPALAQLWRSKQLQYSLLRSLMGRYENFWKITEDALVYAARFLGIDLTLHQRKQLMDAYLYLSLFPDVKPGLEALRARGVRLAILSNGAPEMLRAAADNAGIASLFEAMLSADEVRVFKPDPRVYRMACDRLDVPEGNVGFVSANAWDVSGAASAGLTSFWIQRVAAEPPEQLDHRASRIVSTITELADLAQHRATA